MKYLLVGGTISGIPTMAKSILIKKAYGPDQKVILQAQVERYSRRV